MSKTPMDDVQELRAATREAHEAMKDLRLLIKSMETVREELLDVSHQVFDQRLEEQTSLALKAYQDTVAKAIEDATQAVYKRFDTITDILLGERKSQVPIETLARDYARRRDG